MQSFHIVHMYKTKFVYEIVDLDISRLKLFFVFLNMSIYVLRYCFIWFATLIFSHVSH